MSGREFGIVASSVWNSRLFAQLGSDSARLAFVYALTCRHSNSIGCYRLPPAYMAADRRLDMDQAEAELQELGQLELIDYDGREHVIHIRQWFRHGRMSITNRLHLQGAIRWLSALPQSSPVTALGAADLLHQAYRTAAGWDRSASQMDRSKRDKAADLHATAEDMRKQARAAFAQLARKPGAANYLESVLERDGDIDLSRDLSKALSIDLCIQGTGIESGIKENQEQEQEQDKEQEQRDQIDGKEPRAPSPPPGGRSGALLQRLAAEVLRIADNPKAKPSAILPPTADQLQTLITQGMITDAQCDAYTKATSR